MHPPPLEAAIECPNCHHANEADSLFCTSCGAFLSGQALPNADEPQAGAPVEEQLRSLRDEVRSVQERYGQSIARLQDRVTALEAMAGSLAPRSGPAQAAPAQPVSAAPSATPASAQAPPPPSDSLLAAVREWKWEQIVGGNWLARVGVLALIIGVAFFLKLAIDNDWIGPTGQVALGIAVGVALLAAGEYWQRRYAIFAQALSGGGIGILYLSIFAAHSTFGLIDVYLATGILLLISVTAAAIAIRYESRALAIIGILGAFSAPFILGAFSSSSVGDLARTDTGIDLLAYIIAVDVGVLALSAFRNWRWMVLLGWAGSLLAYGGWYEQFGGDAGLLTAQLSLTLIFLTFVGATTLYHVMLRRPPGATDRVFMTVNALSYFAISYGIMSEDLELWMGAFALVMALFYGGLAYAALRRSEENALLSFFALGIALVFLTVAVPVQLGDAAWTTVAWAAQGAVLMWLAFQVRMPQVRIFGYAAFGLVAVRLFMFDTDVDLGTYDVLLNERVLAFVPSIAAMYVTAYLCWRYRGDLAAWEASLASVYPVFLAAAGFFTLWMLGWEIISGFDKQISALTDEEFRRGVDSWLRNAQNLSITALLAFYAAAMLAVGIIGKSRMVRLAALALLLIPIAKVFAYDVFILEGVYRIAAFIGLGLMLVLGGYVYQRFRKTIRGYLIEG